MRSIVYNTDLAKVAVKRSVLAVPRWVIKFWYSALTFVMKFATFAKPEKKLPASIKIDRLK